MTSAEAHRSAVGEEASSRRAAGAEVNFLLKEKESKDHTLQKKVVQSAGFSNTFACKAPFRLRIYDVARRLKASITNNTNVC